MSRPVVKAGVAGAVLCAFNGLCSFVLPAILPYWRPVWLINPLVAVDVAPRGTESFGDLALSIGLGATLLVTVAFYLDHCVINQPAWALFLGWGMLLGGTVTSTTQEVVHSSHTVFIDINHELWPLGLVDIIVGGLVVLLSWWREPEFFSPYVSRRILLTWLAAITIIQVVGILSGHATIALYLSAVITLVALTAGSWILGQFASRRAGVHGSKLPG
jgi:hypothetical protein